MRSRPAGTYNYTELATRIEQVLGTRPSVQTLRAAVARPGRATAAGKPPRLTAGMPRPIRHPEQGYASRPALFSSAEVEQWLAVHPLLARRSSYEQAERALASGVDVDTVVAEARRGGLSWREITALLAEVEGQPHTAAGVHRRYRDRSQ